MSIWPCLLRNLKQFSLFGQTRMYGSCQREQRKNMALNSTTIWRATCRARDRDRERGQSFKESRVGEIGHRSDLNKEGGIWFSEIKGNGGHWGKIQEKCEAKARLSSIENSRVMPAYLRVGASAGKSGARTLSSQGGIR